MKSPLPVILFLLSILISEIFFIDPWVITFGRETPPAWGPESARFWESGPDYPDYPFNRCPPTQHGFDSTAVQNTYGTYQNGGRILFGVLVECWAIFGFRHRQILAQLIQRNWMIICITFFCTSEMVMGDIHFIPCNTLSAACPVHGTPLETGVTFFGTIIVCWLVFGFLLRRVFTELSRYNWIIISITILSVLWMVLLLLYIIGPPWSCEFRRLEAIFIEKVTLNWPTVIGYLLSLGTGLAAILTSLRSVPEIDGK
jgi:hypothetical protein